MLLQADKVKVLVQIRCLGLTDRIRAHHNLVAEMSSVTGPGGRVAKALSDYMIQRAQYDMDNRSDSTTGEGDPPGHVRTGWLCLKNAIQFSKSVDNEAFERSAQIFAQFRGVGEAIARSHARTST